jgi:hypothetical protein
VAVALVKQIPLQAQVVLVEQVEELLVMVAVVIVITAYLLAQIQEAVLVELTLEPFLVAAVQEL